MTDDPDFDTCICRGSVEASQAQAMRCVMVAPSASAREDAPSTTGADVSDLVARVVEPALSRARGGESNATVHNDGPGV